MNGGHLVDSIVLNKQLTTSLVMVRALCFYNAKNFISIKGANIWNLNTTSVNFKAQTRAQIYIFSYDINCMI